VFILVDIALFTAALSLAAADRLPGFDVEKQCTDIARRAAPFADAGACLRKERSARERLAREWASFAPADKAHCLELSQTADPTYTELLTCLELAREARNIRERERSSSGQAPQ
jgi:hypothetical protein